MVTGPHCEVLCGDRHVGRGRAMSRAVDVDESVIDWLLEG
jgi:hypothetical protein